jgi:PAS domain S-box-containing protein
VQVASKRSVEKLQLRYLPGFAEFIKKEKLVDYIRVQLRYSRELKLPLLRFFEKMSDEDIIAMSIASHTEFLDAVINNQVKEHIEETQQKWIANQLDIIDKYDIAAEDISLVSYIRKKAFIAFLPEYTAILADALAIIGEIDTLNAEADTHATATYMKILREKLNEHTHFIERITETSPGIIYVFDLRDEKEVYANKMMTQLLGYEPGDWKKLEADFVSELIHPEDIPVIEANQKAFTNAADGEVRSIRYRIKNKSGEYRWMRTYESIFKRDAEGKPWQVIGIALDIENEKRTSDKLKHREEQLLEAQALSNVGSFVWKPATGEKETTPQFLKILEVERSEGMDAFIRYVHPADKAIVKTALDNVLNKRTPLDVEFRYNINGKTKIIWLKATADEDLSRPNTIRGTAMDVTDRHHMIQKLQRSEDMNKKAQALTHLGNWSWDLSKNNLEWSDELYRIYGLEPGIPILNTFIRGFNHPEDAEKVDRIIKASYEDHKPYDFYYRIILKDGKLKTLHAIGEVLTDDNDKAYKMIGTLQDVTEKENLIERLRNSEILYKQAQSLSHIGNWRWNIHTEELEWSDEMYRIYGLEPQSEKITLERFISFVHPDDKDYIKASIAEGETKEKYDDVFKIIDANGKIKVLHSVAEVQYDELGQPQYLIGTEQDVTDQEQLVEELQKSRELYKQALEISKIGNWTWDIKSNQIEWDEQTYRNFGIKPADVPVITFDSYMDRIPADTREKLQEAITNCCKTHKPYSLIYRIVLPNGKSRYLEAKGRVVLNEEDEVIKLVGTNQDVTDRELLIDQLQRSESLYKQAQSIAHLGNWMYDVVNDKLFWTDELYRIYGIEPQSQELSWKEFMELVHEDDREIISAFVSEVTKTAKPFEMYHRNIRKDDGSVRTLHIRGEGLKDEHGKVYQLFGTTQDVTEQQHIEQELRENQNFIKKIADATPAIITSYNINTGKYRFISQGIRTLLGYEPEEGLTRGVEFFAELIHPDDVIPTMQKNAKALETANSPDNEDTDIIVDFQYRMKRKDGEYRWFHTFGTVFDRNAQGKVENVLNISIDITDRIRAEETVAEQQKFISHIAEASPTILYLFDLEQKKFLYLNKEVTAVLGYSPEEILSLGDKVYMYLHPEDTIKSADTYVKYKQEGSATMHQFEGRIKSRAGEWKWLLTREVVFKRNEEGKAIQVLGSALDITDRKEMEGSLYKKNIELEQSNSNLEEFAYVASHDLQEPLRKISIFGDRLLINHTESLDDDGKLFLQKIVDSSKRMQSMINDLLSVSLISGNKSFEQCSLKAVLNDVIQTLEVKIEARNARIYVADLPDAWIIPSQMRQLFQNLISNSLKFIAKDRTPEIHITQSAVKYTDLLNYNLPGGKQYIRINVADNGIGFENAYASKIFTIFQRLHGRAEYEGTGIGLAICKKIVENHEGVIFAEGKPGQGSVFSIILPV